jgi:hypothetical protein
MLGYARGGRAGFAGVSGGGYDGDHRAEEGE